jgi:hypothetical protein
LLNWPVSQHARRNICAYADEDSFHPGLYISLILVQSKQEMKKPITRLEEEVRKKGFILFLIPQKKSQTF